MTLNAYRAAVARAETPRATEYRLISEITGEMMAAEAAGARGGALIPTLHRNREMWAAFATDCASEGNGLPPALRAQIISLALWVDGFTSDVMSGRELLSELIGLNRTIMEGLRGEQRAAA